jgi:hypothetical protein
MRRGGIAALAAAVSKAAEVSRWRLAALALAALALAPLAHAAPALQCRAEPQPAVLGQPLRWELSARDAPPLPSFTAADFAPDWLLTDQQGASGSDAQGRREQSAQLTLYPLRAGALALPAVTAGSAQCPAQTVDVLPAPPGQTPLQWRTAFTPPRPYALQPLRLELQAIGGGNLVWDTPTPHSAQALLQPLPAVTRSEIVYGQPQLVQVFAWQVLPLQSGAVTVDFGLVRAHAFGQLRVYAPPPLHFTARALPAWWPADGLVGRPEVRLLTTPARVTLGQTVAWRLRLAAPGLDRRQVLRVVNPWADALPADFGLAGVQVHAAEAEGEAGAWDVAVFLRPTAGGRLTAPALRLPYFDPASELPAAVTWQPPQLVVTDPRPLRVAVALAGGAALVALGFALRALAGGWRCARQRRAHWLALRHAADAAALRDAWLAVAPRRGLPLAATLTQWIDAARLPPQHALRHAAERLAAALYAPHPVPLSGAAFAALRETVAAALRRWR